MVKSVENTCGKNYGEIKKLSDWKRNVCGKKQKTKQKTLELLDSRTRGPLAPAVLVFI